MGGDVVDPGGAEQEEPNACDWREREAQSVGAKSLCKQTSQRQARCPQKSSLRTWAKKRARSWRCSSVNAPHHQTAAGIELTKATEIGTMSPMTLGFAIAIPPTALVTDTAGVKIPSAMAKLVPNKVYTKTEPFDEGLY